MGQQKQEGRWQRGPQTSRRGPEELWTPGAGLFPYSTARTVQVRAVEQPGLWLTWGLGPGGKNGQPSEGHACGPPIPARGSWGGWILTGV